MLSTIIKNVEELFDRFNILSDVLVARDRVADSVSFSHGSMVAVVKVGSVTHNVCVVSISDRAIAVKAERQLFHWCGNPDGVEYSIVEYMLKSVLYSS